MTKKKKIYKKGLIHLRNELDKKFDIERASVGEFCIEIKSEYIRFIQYFLEKEQNNLTVISKLGKSNEEKLNATVNRNTIERLVLADPNDPHKPQGKTYDYLCVSLGYFGWISFQQGKNKIDLSEIITSDSKIFIKENAEGFKQDDSPPHSTAANIPGVTVIDENFRKKIQEGKAFSRAEFYTAKQNDHCQWFGILHHYDIERNLYLDIKTSLENSFKKELTYKVAAVLQGDGGCGKSTVLRKLALDWCREAPFSVVWLMPESLEDFVKDGLEVIKENSSKNYMLIIEDWQVLQLDEKNTKFLLEKSNKIPNLRICIGDRNNDDALYRHYIYDQDNGIFEFTSDENEHIVSEIIKVFSDWKDAASQIFEHKENYKASLFLLLFIMAHKNHSNENSKSKLNLSQPLTAFREIIENDLKKIFKIYPGLGKALYYTAHLYKEYKTSVTYDTFLRFADSFQETSEISKYLSGRNLEGNTTLELVQKYISLKRSPGRGFIHLSGGEEWVHFNHDIFIESGIALIQFKQWENYGEIVKARLMTLLIEQNLWQNDYFITNKLCNDKTLVQRNKKLFFHYVEIVSKIYGYSDSSILDLLQDLDLTNLELLEYVKKILDSFNNSILFGEDEESSLTTFFFHYECKFKEIYDDLFNYCLSLYSDNENEGKNSNNEKHFYLIDLLIQDIDGKQKLYTKILDHPSFLNFESFIIHTCLKGLNDTDKAGKIAHSILLQPEAYLLSPDIISSAISKAEQKITDRFAGNVFRNYFRETKKETLITILNTVHEKEYLELFISRLFYKNDNVEKIETYDFYNINPIIKQELFRIILTKEDWENIIPEILLFAYQEIESVEIKKSLAEKISVNPVWMRENRSRLFSVWEFSKNLTIEQCILENWIDISVDKIFNILVYYMDKNIPSHIQKYISEVIQHYHSIGSKVFHFGDIFLLKIQNSEDFDSEIAQLSRNWQNYERSIIAKFLCSDYTPHTYKHQICDAILSEWENELNMIEDIDERIRQYENLFYGKFSFRPASINVIRLIPRRIEDKAAYYSIFCKRYLFEICLFHPMMKEKAKELLKLITLRGQEALVSIPDSIHKVIENFDSLSIENTYWNDMKNKVVNHIGYNDDEAMYEDLFG